jgi:SAM-dependent methyltransferase
VAGDFDYETGDIDYTAVRRTDPRFAAAIEAALGDARTVINVGAGAGSYEPAEREVTAVEPSAAMRAQRPEHLAPAVEAVAERLPFPDDSFDAAMATVTIHHWDDLDAGLRELRRVSRGPVVILTFDAPELRRLWLADYIPELAAVECRRFPSIDHVVRILGGDVEVQELPIPRDCVDGFGEAFYARPEAFLDPAVRQAQSGWRFVDDAVVETAMSRLARDLESGSWDRRYGSWRSAPSYRGSVRLVIARPARATC